ncbi:X-Pro dipeptidyl-peptidase, partial [Mycobacterium tuberculosis]|nr:X-Pro dipeptidyl-peptidase [Mycobacterium tuberculosis]
VELRATVVRPATRFGEVVTTPYPAIININPYNRAAIDFIDTTMHAPVLGSAVRAAARSVDASGTALEGLTTLTQTLAG